MGSHISTCSPPPNCPESQLFCLQAAGPLCCLVQTQALRASRCAHLCSEGLNSVWCVERQVRHLKDSASLSPPQKTWGGPAAQGRGLPSFRDHGRQSLERSKAGGGPGQGALAVCTAACVCLGVFVCLW